jgi:hypothetical protein
MRSKSSLDNAASMSAIVERRISSGVANLVAASAVVTSAVEAERPANLRCASALLDSLNSGNCSSSRTSTFSGFFCRTSRPLYVIRK